MKKLLDVMSSFGLSVAIFALLTLITWLGTLAQADIGLFRAQEKYFESWLIAQQVIGPVYVPLPGGLLLMVTLFANLVLGGLWRMKWRWDKAGILITHFGMLFLLFAGFWKYAFAEEGGLQLFEGMRSSEYVSYYDWEIVIEEAAGDEVRSWVVPDTAFDDRTGRDRVAEIQADGLPFVLEVSHFMPHSTVRRAGPMVDRGPHVADGFALEAREMEKEAEANVAGCVAVVRPTDGNRATHGILWGRALYPWTVEVGDRTFGVTLRKKRMPMPFEIHLDKFTHEYHPNTRIPRKYMSDVTVRDDAGPVAHKIRMNEPLRQDGMIVFQSSWGPTDARPGDRLYSGFSVVRNPADKWPEYSLWVIVSGMLIHFVMRLFRFILRETAPTKKAPEEAVA